MRLLKFMSFREPAIKCHYASSRGVIVSNIKDNTWWKKHHFLLGKRILEGEKLPQVSRTFASKKSSKNVSIDFVWCTDVVKQYGIACAQRYKDCWKKEVKKKTKKYNYQEHQNTSIINLFQSHTAIKRKRLSIGKKVPWPWDININLKFCCCHRIMRNWCFVHFTRQEI